MYTIVNTYPKETASNVKEIKNAVARVIYKELVRLLEKKTELPCNT